MKRLPVVLLVILAAACGRDAGISTAPSDCPKDAAHVIAVDTEWVEPVHLPIAVVTAYGCNGVVKTARMLLYRSEPR
jgi:hypothetical protein